MMRNLKRSSMFSINSIRYFTIIAFALVSARDLAVVDSFFLIIPLSHNSLLISVSFHSGHMGARRNRRLSIGLNTNRGQLVTMSCFYVLIR